MMSFFKKHFEIKAELNEADRFRSKDITTYLMFISVGLRLSLKFFLFNHNYVITLILISIYIHLFSRKQEKHG